MGRRSRITPRKDKKTDAQREAEAAAEAAAEKERWDAVSRLAQATPYDDPESGDDALAIKAARGDTGPLVSRLRYQMTGCTLNRTFVGLGRYALEREKYLRGEGPKPSIFRCVLASKGYQKEDFADGSVNRDPGYVPVHVAANRATAASYLSVVSGNLAAGVRLASGIVKKKLADMAKKVFYFYGDTFLLSSGQRELTREELAGQFRIDRKSAGTHLNRALEIARNPGVKWVSDASEDARPAYQPEVEPVEEPSEEFPNPFDSPERISAREDARELAEEAELYPEKEE
jgi:hypothetical protein